MIGKTSPFAIRTPGLEGGGAVVPRSDMQTDPQVSLQPLPCPRLPGRGPSDDDKPTCGGVLPVFLSVGFHGALKKKKRHFTENNAGWGGGGNFVMFLGKVQEQICL